MGLRKTSLRACRRAGRMEFLRMLCTAVLLALYMRHSFIDELKTKTARGDKASLKQMIRTITEITILHNLRPTVICVRAAIQRVEVVVIIIVQVRNIWVMGAGRHCETKLVPRKVMCDAKTVEHRAAQN